MAATIATAQADTMNSAPASRALGQRIKGCAEPEGRWWGEEAASTTQGQRMNLAFRFDAVTDVSRSPCSAVNK